LAPDSDAQAGMAQLVAGAVSRLQAPEGLDPRLDGLAERLQALAIESQELAVELRDYSARSEAEYLDGWDAGEDTESGATGAPLTSLDTLEERIAAVERLKRRHGGNVGTVLEYADHA